MRQQGLPDILEQLLLERDGLLLRAQRFGLERLQLLRDVALGVRRRLLARPGR